MPVARCCAPKVRLSTDSILLSETVRRASRRYCRATPQAFRTWRLEHQCPTFICNRNGLVDKVGPEELGHLTDAQHLVLLHSRLVPVPPDDVRSRPRAGVVPSAD